MTALAVETVVAQLTDADLNLSLAADAGLAVSPSSHLTADLRALIRSNKALLIDWLMAANDAASQTPDSPSNHVDWNKLATAYHAHHFECPTCIAAGRGRRYGQRCRAGMVLWGAYCR